MPKWAGKWKGGRFYLDAEGTKVFFIERRVAGTLRSIKLNVHGDQDLANGELANFLKDPVAYVRPPPEPAAPASAVTITKERLLLYMDSIHDCVEDHRKARRSDLHAWAAYRTDDGQALDLATADKRALRVALGSFGGDTKDKRRTGGFKRRAEALNAFCNFLVKEGDLKHWNPIAITPGQKPAERRAERVAYSVEEVQARYRTLTDRALRDVLMVRVSTGMHHTEIEQLEGCKVHDGPLPDRGVGIRVLPPGHEIAGVLQFKQKTKPRHRVSVSAPVLAAALRLRDGVPGRIAVWEAFDPIIPSNLRHTWVTLCGEVGEIVTYKATGIPLDQIQGMAGHRIGSKVTESHYDKLQVPNMPRLPLNWDLV